MCKCLKPIMFVGPKDLEGENIIYSSIKTGIDIIYNPVRFLIREVCKSEDASIGFIEISVVSTGSGLSRVVFFIEKYGDKFNVPGFETANVTLMDTKAQVFKLNLPGYIDDEYWCLEEILSVWIMGELNEALDLYSAFDPDAYTEYLRSLSK